MSCDLVKSKYYGLIMNGSKKDADDIYNLGIARKASPLDQLQNRYNEFQKRMLSGAAMPSTVTSSDASSSTSDSRPSSRPQRSALTTTRTTLTPSGSSRPSSLTPSMPNSRLQVFMDPSGAEAEAVEAGAWPDLGTRKSRVKENVPEVKRLAGTTIKQGGRSKRIASGSGGNSAGASSSRIVPYRDPDPVGLPPPVNPASKKTMAFVPFMDSGDAAPAAPSTPATPRFTPFRDDVSLKAIIVP